MEEIKKPKLKNSALESMIRATTEGMSFEEWLRGSVVENFDSDEEPDSDMVYMTCPYCGHEWEYELVYGFRDPDDKICPKCGK